MQGRTHLLLIGQVLLCTLMFSGVLDIGAVAYASETPQCTISASGTGSGAFHSDVTADVNTGSVMSWRYQQAQLFAKVPKAKSTLPCHQWVLAVPTLAAPFHLRAGFPLHALAATYCYAIHPRPPSSLTA
ncbi:MAG: hypothetical protein ACYDBB_15005 [Armatimonadota bacterium]